MKSFINRITYRVNPYILAGVVLGVGSIGIVAVASAAGNVPVANSANSNKIRVIVDPSPSVSPAAVSTPTSSEPAVSDTEQANVPVSAGEPADDAGEPTTTPQPSASPSPAPTMPPLVVNKKEKIVIVTEKDVASYPPVIPQ